MTLTTLPARVLRIFGSALLPLCTAGQALGLGLAWAGRDDLAAITWVVPSGIVGARLAWSILRDLLAREAGVDVIAVLAIGGALAMEEAFAAAVIALMLATGEALERYAEGRAHRELTALLGRAPRDVHRYEDGELVTRPIDAVVIGDRLLVKPGEVVPVDGLLDGAAAVLDEAALTGEARPVTRVDGDQVSSGTLNAGAPFDLRAIATAEQSTYAGIVRLVRQAEGSKAPFVRLADRYALLFVPLTLAIAGLAWLVSGDPGRALAVVVVATPCPLLLAAPIAIVAGISRAARRGIIVKGGGPLETIARARVLLFDKTGTLTAGRPRLAGVEGARERGLTLSFPTDVVETPGSGVSGRVDGRDVQVGSADFAGHVGAGGGSLPAWARELRRRGALEGSTHVFVRADDRLAGALVLDDPIRPETPRAIRSLRRAGITRIVMVTGDHTSVAEIVGAAIGVDGVLAERTPADKVDAVRQEMADSLGPVVMVGDGINDAPALAIADVGVAMGARGATASSEAADLVITVDRLDRLAEAIRLAKRSRQIAVQSVIAGMGMSLVAMGFAAFGALPVVAGALIQEAIDVAVILNALRALRGGTEVRAHVPGWAETSAGLRTRAPQTCAGARADPAAGRWDRRAPGRRGRGRAGGHPVVPRGRPHAARAPGGPDDLPDAGPGDRQRGRDCRAPSDAHGDLPPDRALRSAGGGPPAGGSGARGPRGPAARPVRPGRDPATPHGTGGGTLRLARRRVGGRGRGLSGRDQGPGDGLGAGRRGPTARST